LNPLTTPFSSISNTCSYAASILISIDTISLVMYFLSMIIVRLTVSTNSGSVGFSGSRGTVCSTLYSKFLNTSPLILIVISSLATLYPSVGSIFS